jgi:hypothetical protein
MLNVFATFSHGPTVHLAARVAKPCLRSLLPWTKP